MRQRLILKVPSGLDAARLSSALAAGDVAAVVIDTATGDASGSTTADLVAASQEAGAAALIVGTRWPAAHGADGLHLAEDEVSPLKAKPDGAVCGAATPDRHRAMLAGEAGADYVWFDGTGDLPAACALATWWQEAFEVPAVVAGGADAVSAMILSRAEFVAMVDAFDDHHDAAALVAAANTLLDTAQEAA